MRKATRKSCGSVLSASEVETTCQNILQNSSRISSQRTIEAVKCYSATDEVEITTEALLDLSDIEDEDCSRCSRKRLSSSRVFRSSKLSTAPHYAGILGVPVRVLSREVILRQLRIDEYFDEIVKNNAKTITSVELRRDGSYSAVEPPQRIDAIIKDEEPYEADLTVVDEKPVIMPSQPSNEHLIGPKTGIVPLQIASASLHTLGERTGSAGGHPTTEHVGTQQTGSARAMQRSRFECQVCHKFVGHLPTHMRTHTGERPFECDQCEKTFTLAGTLRTHQRSHSSVRQFSCTECPKQFCIRQHLDMHLMIHRNEKPFVCDMCGKRFSRESTLKVHRQTHTDERRFKCDQCEKLCLTKSNLQEHQRTHTKVKPYPCSECDMKFAYITNLKTHARQHTGEKPYKCGSCPKSFTQWNQLDSHKKVHTGEKPYECPQCPKRFAHTGTLKLHVRTHSGEKPYKCQTCPKAFAQLGGLKVHVRTHTGEKPLRCDHCGQGFTSHSTRNRHIRSIHLGIRR